MDKFFCMNCGAQVYATEMVCPACGKQTRKPLAGDPKPSTPAKSTLVSPPSVEPEVVPDPLASQPAAPRQVRIDHSLVWVTAFVPLAGLVVDGVLLGMGVSLWIGTVIVIGANVAMLTKDEENLRKAGFDTSELQAWLVPVYLFKRVNLTGSGYGYAVCWLITFLLAIMPSGGAYIAPSGGGYAVPTGLTSTGGGGTVITAAEYNRIDTGMTYQQVRQIIGADGQETARSEMAGIVTVGVQWVNPDGSNIQTMFQDGKLVSIAMLGLR